MVLLESLALVGGLKDIFLYNRDLYMFNREINQDRIIQTQKMRIEQILLFRQDLRKLFDLTVGKMESYLVVNTLTLAFCMAFFYEGRLPQDTPAWLFWLWAMSLATAVLFLIMSVWFAIYATITAQTFAVRLLTQWLRLPVPSKTDIEKAAATAAEFEKQSRSALLRVPIVSKETQSGLQARYEEPSSSSNDPVSAVGRPRMRTSASEGDIAGKRGAQEEESTPQMVNPALQVMFAKEYQSFVEHFHLFRYLQENWGGYDAYARVCMVVGSAQLLSVIGYMGIALYIADYARWGAAVFTLLLVVFAIIHARMNLLLSRRELYTLCFFLVAGPFTGCCAAILYYIDRPQLYGSVIAWMAPVAFMFHFCSITFFVAVGSEKNKALPTKFSTVISIDVLGLWEEEDKLVHDEEEFDQDGWDDQARAAMRATGAALTGWQKRWLKATTREAPVSALIPPSRDISAAEKERHLRPRASNRNLILNRMAASSSMLGGGLDANHDDDLHRQSIDSSSRAAEYAPTKHIQTLPWVAFRQAGAVVCLIWLISVGIGIAVAIFGDIPGWDSNPSSHQSVTGATALWSPLHAAIVVPDGGQSRKLGSRGSNNFFAILENSQFSDSARVAFAPQVAVQSIHGVSKEGLHVVAANARYVVTEEFRIVDYNEYPSMAGFRDLTANRIEDPAVSIPRSRAPWCGPSDIITMVNEDVYRDCNNLASVWTWEDHPSVSSQFNSVAGRFGLNSVDHSIYKFQIHRRSSSMRIETRIPVPVTLSGNIVDIAKNEFLMTCITRDGLVGVWSTHHGEVPSKGIRLLPNRETVEWKSIVGAGGRSFVVFGELRATGMNEAFFVQDILSLQKMNRFGHA